MGYQAQPHQWDTVVFRADRERVITALESRFTLLVDSSPTAHAVRFRLGVRPDDGAAPMP